jgi:GNAT superfamily N-acetyltransferase
MDTEIKTSEKMNGSPALPLLVEGWSELFRNGHASPDVAIAWDHSVLWIEDGGVPVAAMSYHYTDWNRQFWINLGYVKPSHRRRGLYRKLYEEAHRIAVEKKAHHISGGTNWNNHIMRATAEDLGRKPDYVIYTEVL